MVNLKDPESLYTYKLPDGEVHYVKYDSQTTLCNKNAEGLCTPLSAVKEPRAFVKSLCNECTSEEIILWKK